MRLLFLLGSTSLERLTCAVGRQFSQAIYRDVAHGMMLHKRRRKLHREAALVTKDLLDRMGQHENKGASWMPSEWELRAKLAYHWLQLVQGLNKSNIRLHVSEDDLERLAASVSWMLSQHFARGDLKEAMFLQVMRACLLCFGTCRSESRSPGADCSGF